MNRYPVDTSDLELVEADEWAMWYGVGGIITIIIIVLVILWIL